MAELSHGGRLREAAACYGIPLEQWLDLSTGINPHGWPVPALPSSCWQRLPEADDGLEQAAAAYYGTAQLLPVAGSQAAIQALPQLRSSCRVGMLAPSYAEHAKAWQCKGHKVVALEAETITAQLPTLDVLLLVNPNNPTGESFSPEQLLAWHDVLASRDGWLVVDEAFIDTIPERSLAPWCGMPGLVVFRSLGKFFGLAGARVGFVLAWPSLMQHLNEILGPWAVSGPAREAARQALQDQAWQARMRGQLKQQSLRLENLLKRQGLPPAAGTALFQYCPCRQAALWHERLAQQGILTRLFSEPAALRFGMPGSEEDWQRLERALEQLQISPTQRAFGC